MEPVQTRYSSKRKGPAGASTGREVVVAVEAVGAAVGAAVPGQSLGKAVLPFCLRWRRRQGEAAVIIAAAAALGQQQQ